MDNTKTVGLFWTRQEKAENNQNPSVIMKTETLPASEKGGSVLDDAEIIELFWTRQEVALSALAGKYSRYCRSVAYNILNCAEDAEEVLNDTYSRMWNAIPPKRPDNLLAFMAKITRNLSLDALAKGKADKRGGGRFDVILSELQECIADKRNSVDELAESEAITAAINLFLCGESAENRRVFVRRYWRAASVEDIAGEFGVSVSKVKSVLFRMRGRLRKILESEGIYI